MPYDIQDEGKGFYIRHHGHVNFDEIAEANDVLISHASFPEHTYQIWNYLEAGAISGEKRDARVISKVDGMSLGKAGSNAIRVAFVTSNAKSIEFISSYIDIIDPDQIEAKIFRTENEARRWVDAEK